MDEIGKMLAGSGPVGVAATIAMALLGFAAYLPKLLNSYKGDQLAGNVLDRIRELEKKSDEQDAKIHQFSIRVTRLIVLVIRLEALLVDRKIPIPQDVVNEMNELRKNPEAE